MTKKQRKALAWCFTGLGDSCCSVTNRQMQTLASLGLFLAVKPHPKHQVSERVRTVKAGLAGVSQGVLTTTSAYPSHFYFGNQGPFIPGPNKTWLNRAHPDRHVGRKAGLPVLKSECHSLLWITGGYMWFAFCTHETETTLVIPTE